MGGGCYLEVDGYYYVQCGDGDDGEGEQFVCLDLVVGGLVVGQGDGQLLQVYCYCYQQVVVVGVVVQV